MNKLNHLAQTILRSPVLWGTLGAILFYGLVHGGPLDLPLVRRYFTNHPVEYAETLMFAIGLAALVLKALDVVAQKRGLGQSPLGSVVAAEGQSAEEQVKTLAERLGRLSDARQQEPYVRRLRAAVDYVGRLGSAEGLDDRAQAAGRPRRRPRARRLRPVPR